MPPCLPRCLQPLRCLPAIALLAFAWPGRSQNPPGPVAGEVASPVAGEVADAQTGRRLPHALVTLIDLRTEQPAASTYTGEDGRFAFGKTPAAGKYRLVGQAAGHLDASYRQHDQFSTAIVTGAALATGDLLLMLPPEAAIAGHLADENGDPVPRATVTLYRQSLETGTKAVRRYGSLSVEDDGDFRFGRLPPGQYFLSASGTPWYAVPPPMELPGEPEPYRVSIDPALDVAYPTLVYPAASRSDDASPLALHAGEQLTVNLQFVPTPAVTLTLNQPASDAASAVPQQLTQTLFGVEVPVQASVQMGPHTERLQGVAPGRYTLHTYGNGIRMPLNGGEVDLSGGAVTREATDTAALGQVRLTVRARTPGSLPAKAMVTLVSGEDDERRVSAEVTEHGEATFADVPPGEYSLRLTSERGPLHVGALEGNPAGVRAGHLVITGAETVKATLRVDGPGIQVNGFVHRDGRPVPAALVLLVPAQRAVNPELFRRDQSDLDGSFSLRDVPPGDYLLLALTDAWSLPWADLHALAPYLSHAQPLRVPLTREGSLALHEAVEAQALR